MGKLIDFTPINSKSLIVRNKTSDEVEIVMYGAIGASFWEDSISASQFSKELDKAKDAKVINLRLNSAGGDVFDGIAIYNRLKQHKAKVVVYVDGLAASIASIIMLAGDEIVLGEGSLVMIHKPWTMAYGNSKDLEGVIERLDDVETQLVSIYTKKTGLSRDEIKAMLSKETWMDATEAIELGFADSTYNNEYQVAASANVPWINKRPEVKNKANETIKNKIATLKGSIEGLLDRK